MSPVEPNAVERALRTADRAAQAGLTPDALDRIEGAVLRRIGEPSRSTLNLPAWFPATAAAGGLAVAAFLLVRWEGAAGPVSVPARLATSLSAGDPLLAPALNSAGLTRAARERFGLAADAPVRRVVLAEFERFADSAVTGLADGAQIDLSAGAASGSYSLQVPSSQDGLVLEVPAADRRGVAGVSVWTRGAGSGVSVELTAVLEDGAELAIQALRLDPATWRQALFPLDATRVRDGGGVRSLRFSVTGREPARLDKIELWTTTGEARR